MENMPFNVPENRRTATVCGASSARIRNSQMPIVAMFAFRKITPVRPNGPDAAAQSVGGAVAWAVARVSGCGYLEFAAASRLNQIAELSELCSSISRLWRAVPRLS